MCVEGGGLDGERGGEGEEEEEEEELGHVIRLGTWDLGVEERKGGGLEEVG